MTTDETAMSYDASCPADWTSYDRVATASDDLRMVFTMHAVVTDLKRVLGPENYRAVLEYLDCIDKNVEKMGKHAIAWAKETLDESMRNRIRRVTENPNATTNEVWNLLETRADEGQEDNHYNHDDVEQDVGGFREPSQEDLASAAALNSRVDEIYEWLLGNARSDFLALRTDLPGNAKLPREEEVAIVLRRKAMTIALVERQRMTKESNR